MAALPSMDAFPAWPPPDPLTEYAKIYGHPPIGQLQNPGFSHAVLKDIVPLKSGYSPLERSQFPTTQQYDDLSAYQRARFLGFAEAELDVMEALALASLKGPSVELPKVELHSCLRRPLWEKPLPKHLALFPIRNGMGGNWEASNPVDALSLGEFRDITDDAIVFDKKPKIEDDTYLQFFRLDPAISEEPRRRQKVEERFSEIRQELEWHLTSCHLDNEAGFTGQHSFGVTTKRNSEQDTRAHVGFELAEPLLNPNIIPADRMACRFKLTCTILHELAHAVWMSTGIRELGFSMENAILVVVKSVWDMLGFGGVPIDSRDRSQRSGPRNRIRSILDPFGAGNLIIADVVKWQMPAVHVES
ncbi:uncharacterized protein PAC_08522 [Phialocephala subalpina]|uniref:Uncharacterized protein n=1 Tax=Phialocephala subalpina TaxID=576137 RepID=A0A1L7X0U5_9HELO|nr:uncharacterized protein PAC_08522 [Phialocephala subalpina]